MSKSSISLAFTGDICLTFLADADQSEQTFLQTEWPAIRQAIGPHDFLVGNLECCVVDNDNLDEVRAQKMAVPAKAADFLQAAGFTDLNLANNHMLDCGPEAIQYTQQRLDAHGIRHFGAGSNQHEAEATVLSERGAHRIAFLSACDDSAYYARTRRPGIAPMLKSRLGRRVRTAAQQADLVVVTLHADLEFSPAPGIWRQRLSRWLIRQGTHLVIQHHPHVLQGVEAYRGGLIAYSLGNFIFRLRGNAYQGGKPGIHDSLVLVVDADLSATQPELSYRIVPARIGDNHLPTRLADQEQQHAQRNMAALSALLNDHKTHRRAWHRRCRAEAYARAYRIYCALSRGQFRKAGRESWWLLARPEDRRWIAGLFSFGFL